jgi:NADH-ubiquinone oxidoreductase chain 5
MSQIGYLFMAVGLSQYNVALFHLVNHRFFKRLLFLAAGIIIASLKIVILPKKLLHPL